MKLEQENEPQYFTVVSIVLIIPGFIFDSKSGSACKPIT